MKQILVTGFPGFLASQCIEQCQASQEEYYWHLLVLPAEITTTLTALRQLQMPTTHYRLYPADVCTPDLGLAPQERALLQSTITIAFHFAALYDLTAPEAASYAVNVLGTTHILDLLAQCPQLKKFNYISTCYVSGTTDGPVAEDALITPPGFRNFYERTKHQAEQVVRNRMSDMPTTIFRPAIVIGHSETGETNKFDGPYNVILFFRWGHRRFMAMPNLGFTDSGFNSVPVDFVARVIHRVGTAEHDFVGKTLHIADPEPPTTAAMFDFFYHAITGRKTFAIPRWLNRGILWLLHLFPFNLMTGISSQAIDYFFHRGTFQTDNLRTACTQFQIPLPHWQDFYHSVVAFALHNDRPCPNATLLQHFQRWCLSFRFIYLGLGLVMLFAPSLVTGALTLWDGASTQQLLAGDNVVWRILAISLIATLFIATFSLERKPFQKPLHIIFITAKSLSAILFVVFGLTRGSPALLIAGLVDGIIFTFHALFYIRLRRIREMGGPETSWAFFNVWFPSRFIRDFCHTMSPALTYPLDAAAAEDGVRLHVRHMPWHMRYLFIACAYYVFLLLPLCYGRPPYLLMPRSWRLRFLKRAQHARLPIVRIPLLLLKMVCTAHVYKQPAYLRSIGAT